MCEFKIIKVNDGSQIAEDILVLSYNEDNELIFKDVLGLGNKLESALILDVNTLIQTAQVFEHPLIKNFIGLMKNLKDQKLTKVEIEDFQQKLEILKDSLK